MADHLYVCIITSCNRVVPEVVDIVTKDGIEDLAKSINSGILPKSFDDDYIKYLLEKCTYQISCGTRCIDVPILHCIKKGKQTVAEIMTEVKSTIV